MTHESRFATFYEDVTGHQPFDWQAELAAYLCEHGPPDVIDVPTGFGKTSTLHCWAYALATTAAVPRRLFFVIDRRLVVDSAYEDAQRLVAVFKHASADRSRGSQVTRDVAQSLARLHGDEDLEPLAAVRMRGGTSWESRWLTRPDQAALVVGTVDQFGSRLLFRGYGTSDRMKPIDAALVGTDAWLIIDEAHISRPLIQTAKDAARYQHISERTVAADLRVTAMSATADAEGTAFVGDPDEQAQSIRFDRSATEAARRLAARKPTALIELTDLARAGPRLRRIVSAKLGAAMANLAHHSTESAQVVGVIANTVATARAAYEELVRISDDNAQVVLLTGRSRPFDRERIAREDLTPFKVGADRYPVGTRQFLVATQTIEVGADLDLDALVTECAPLSSLTQRFGRVNRIGARAEFLSWVVFGNLMHENDPVYGDVTGATWRLLSEQDTEILKLASKDLKRPAPSSSNTDVIGFGLKDTRRYAEIARDEVKPAKDIHHQLLGVHIERWAATSPVPYPDQPVAPFIRSIEQRPRQDVEVAWRTPPPGHDNVPNSNARRVMWENWLSLAPPASAEFVSVPVWEVRALLAGKTPVGVTSDLESDLVSDDYDETFGVTQPDIPAGVRFRQGVDTDLAILSTAAVNEIEAGDRIILDCAMGGYDRWGWTGSPSNGESLPVDDLGDVVGYANGLSDTTGWGTAGKPLQIRVALLPGVPDEWRHRSRLMPNETLDDVPNVEDVTPYVRAMVLLRDLGFAELLDSPRSWTVDAVPLRPAQDSQRGPADITLVLRSGSSAVGGDPRAVFDDDAVSTSMTGAQLSLEQHGDDVGELARMFGDHLGLPADVARTVELAARWHDLGKADPRFQVMLYDGELLQAAAGELIAKSGRDLRDPIARSARRASELPRRFRHEAVSAALVEELLRATDTLDPDVDVELLRHLVASHHGYARPLLPPIDDPEAPTVEAAVMGTKVRVEPRSQVDWRHPEVFERLNQRYGWWGLALLEALVRLADMRCSEVGGSS